MSKILNQKRFVSIRGKVTEVTVFMATKNNTEFFVQPVFGGITELVPEHLFFHESPSGLMLRDSVEFKRRFPKVPVEQAQVSF